MAETRVVGRPGRVYNNRNYYARKRGELPEVEYLSVDECIRVAGIPAEDCLIFYPFARNSDLHFYAAGKYYFIPMRSDVSFRNTCLHLYVDGTYLLKTGAEQFEFSPCGKGYLNV